MIAFRLDECHSTYSIWIVCGNNSRTKNKGKDIGQKRGEKLKGKIASKITGDKLLAK
jgi:hypothetical protein